MHDGPAPGAPEREDILASIFNKTAPTAGQGLQTNEHLHNGESFATFMVSRLDGLPPQGRRPHPHPGTRRKKESPLTLHGLMPLFLTRHMFAPTLPRWDRRERSCRRTAC